MEKFIQDWKTCDMSLIWKAQLDDKLPKVSRRRLENVKLGKIIQKDFAQLIDENSLSIGKWGYILFGTCVIQKKKLAYLLVDSRKLLNQISHAGRTDFKVKKKIPKAAEADDNFEIPEINIDDLTDLMNGNTARHQDITLRERQEEFLTFDQEMLDFENTLAINLDDPEQVRHVQDLFEHTNNTNIGDGPSFANKEQDLSTRTPSAEQPTIPDPVPEVPEPQVPENPLPSETIPPPEQFADREHPDPPRNEVPQPDPANFKLRELTSDEIREIRTPKNQRDGQPKPKKAKRNQKLIIDSELECPEFRQLRKSKEVDMHTNSKEDIAKKLGFANEISHSDFRDLKMFNPWFGLENQTLRQLYSTPLIRIQKDIKEAIDFSGVKNGKEIERLQNERNMDASNEGNRDESNIPGGASGTFGTGTEDGDRTKQSTGVEQDMTVNQSNVQQKAQQEDLPPVPEVPEPQLPSVPEPQFQPNVQSPSRVPSPTRPEIPSMASLNLNEPNSSRSHRSSQFSFTSQDAAQSISYELTKTGSCTFNDVASKLKDRQQVASSFYQLLVMANTEQVTVSQSQEIPFADIKIKKNDL